MQRRKFITLLGSGVALALSWPLSSLSTAVRRHWKRLVAAFSRPAEVGGSSGLIKSAQCRRSRV